MAVFSGFVAPLAGQLNLKSQSALYKVTTTQMAYQVRFNRHLLSLLSLTSYIELCCFSWSGLRWVLLCTSISQARPKLSHILDPDRLSPNSGMGSSHDSSWGLQFLYRLQILLRILRRDHWCTWSSHLS